MVLAGWLRKLQQGKSTLGWVNPFFYQNPDIFTDIVKGANEAGSGCGEKGFSAVTVSVPAAPAPVSEMDCELHLIFGAQFRAGFKCGAACARVRVCMGLFLVQLSSVR